jgi:hypothetical protein
MLAHRSDRQAVGPYAQCVTWVGRALRLTGFHHAFSVRKTHLLTSVAKKNADELPALTRRLRYGYWFSCSSITQRKCIWQAEQPACKAHFSTPNEAPWIGDRRSKPGELTCFPSPIVMDSVQRTPSNRCVRAGNLASVCVQQGVSFDIALNSTQKIRNL